MSREGGEGWGGEIGSGEMGDARGSGEMGDSRGSGEMGDAREGARERVGDISVNTDTSAAMPSCAFLRGGEGGGKGWRRRLSDGGVERELQRAVGECGKWTVCLGRTCVELREQVERERAREREREREI